MHLPTQLTTCSNNVQVVRRSHQTNGAKLVLLLVQTSPDKKQHGQPHTRQSLPWPRLCHLYYHEVCLSRLHDVDQLKRPSTYGGVVEAEDGNGTVYWLPRNQYPLGLWKELKSGMITLPFQVGFRPLSRIVRHYHESEKYTLEHASANAGWICVVGVAPEGQGKGHCRRMMETAIDAMRAQGMDEIWLTTDKDVNVTIYKKLGFQVMTEKVISSSGVKSWTMKYV
ncbi:unnamed protein product [Aphanomyces euteiches]